MPPKIILTNNANNTETTLWAPTIPFGSGNFGRLWRLNCAQPEITRGYETAYLTVNQKLTGHLVFKQSTVHLKDDEAFQEEKKFIEQEADFLRRAHPDWNDNIATLTMTKGLIGLIMPFYAGRNLSNYHDRKLLTHFTFLSLSIKIVEALLDLHKKEIVHLDIKSDNILAIIENEEVKDVRLIDFGSAAEKNDLIYKQQVQSEKEYPHLSTDRKTSIGMTEMTPAQYRHDYYSACYTLFYLHPKDGHRDDDIPDKIKETQRHYDNSTHTDSTAFLELNNFFISELNPKTDADDSLMEELMFEIEDVDVMNYRF